MTKKNIPPFLKALLNPLRPEGAPPLECEGCEELECQDCCDHDELDCGHCLDCGADRTEDLMCRVYDSYKDSKYE